MTLPYFIDAMRAKEPDNPLAFLDNPLYNQEYKWDGTRTFAFIDTLIQLVGKTWKQEYRWLDKIYNELPSLKCDSRTILDCETVWIKPDGKDYFLTVEAKPETIAEKKLTPRLMIFDILTFNDVSVRSLPLTERKEILRNIIPDGLKYIQYVEPIDNTYNNYNNIIENGGEGVVVKLKTSPYIADEKLSKRLGYWIKIKKVKTEDCIVLGCSKGNGYRASNFGSLILGQYTEDGKLIFVGKEGKMSFDLIDRLHSMMKQREQFNCPVDNYPDNDVLLWCNPKIDPIVVEVQYHKRTCNNIMRFPKFKRVRTDKLAKECIDWKYR